MLSGGIFFLSNPHLIHHHHSTASLKMEDRERFEEVKKADSVSTMIHDARRVLKEELQPAGTLLCLALLQLAHCPAVLLAPKGARKRKNLQLALNALACRLTARGAICSGTRYAKWAGGSRSQRHRRAATCSFTQDDV